MAHYMGVDVSCETLDVGEVRTSSTRRFPNTLAGVVVLGQWLTARLEKEDLHVVLEPTSTYHHRLVQALARRGIRYTVINPARTAAFARLQGKRAKTDRVDARLLAALGESQEPPRSPPPDEAQEGLKTLRRHLAWLEGEVRAARNRLAAAQHSPWTPPTVVDSLERTLQQREQEAERVAQELDAQVRQNAGWERQVRPPHDHPWGGPTHGGASPE